jgi:hypothetical protein
MNNKFIDVLLKIFSLIGTMCFFGIFIAQFLFQSIGLYLIAVCFFCFAGVFFIKYTREVQRVSLRVVLVSLGLLSISAFAVFGIYKNLQVKTLYKFDMQRTDKNTFQGTFNIPTNVLNDGKQHTLVASFDIYSSRETNGSYDFIATLQTPQKTLTKKFSFSTIKGDVSFNTAVSEAFLVENGDYPIIIAPTKDIPGLSSIRSVKILVQEPSK